MNLAELNGAKHFVKSTVAPGKAIPSDFSAVEAAINANDSKNERADKRAITVDLIGKLNETDGK